MAVKKGIVIVKTVTEVTMQITKSKTNKNLTYPDVEIFPLNCIERLKSGISKINFIFSNQMIMRNNKLIHLFTTAKILTIAAIVKLDWEYFL